MEGGNDLVPGEEWKPPSLASDSFLKRPWPQPIAEGVSLESLVAKHQKYTDAWTASSGYSACREMLTNTVLKQANIQITQCICLCLYSLSADDSAPKHYNRSMSQLVALESWVDVLSMCQYLQSHNLPKQAITHHRQRRNTISQRSTSKTLRLILLINNFSHRVATQCSNIRNLTCICQRQLFSSLIWGDWM